MEAKQFITRVSSGLRQSISPAGDFCLPFRIVLCRAPAHILREFQPLVRLQGIDRVFDFREAHRWKFTNYRAANKAGVELNQNPSQRKKTSF